MSNFKKSKGGKTFFFFFPPSLKTASSFSRYILKSLPLEPESDPLSPGKSSGILLLILLQRQAQK